MTATTQEQLAAALPNVGRKVAPAAPEAYAAHLAHQAEIERIRRQHAEARKTAPGYSHALGCFYSPKAAVAFVNGQVEADRPALKIAAE